MCGICGEIRFQAENAPVQAVQQMMQRMASRGPDAEGLYAQDNTVLGQRRLKIIDLSEKAQQPMVDSELGLTIVYNGALYNYPELRKSLSDKGYRFFSSGDTEVILKAYHAWGERAVEKFNGMFAFAIWERDRRRLFLARDRLGIKPLYLVSRPGGLRFASTLPAVIAPGDVPGDIDPVALNHYLSFHAVVPPPRTILRSVQKLPPATTCTVTSEGRMTQRRYWQLPFGASAEEKRFEAEDWRRSLLDALRRSVRRRMIADVPVGVLLSGGLDSSLLVGLLDEAGQHGLRTFSIGFDSAGGESGNEFAFSDIVAEAFATRHQKIRINGNHRVLEDLERCVRQMSEPMVSHDCIGFYLLSQEVSRHVKVVQSGQGADEVFAGYHWYPPLASCGNPLEAYTAGFFDRDFEEYRATVAPAWVDRDFARDYVAAHFEGDGARDAMEKALRLDTTVMLVDDPVKRVDNMTMAWGLEARVPFLDHEVVELAARIPSALKIAHGGKGILKEVARGIVPDAVIDRPKGYFPVPALKHLEGAYLEFVREILDSPAAKSRGLFNPDYIAELMAAPERQLTPLRGNKLWQMALLEHWLTLQGI